MSASTERKNRQAAREAGTDKKTIARQEAEKKAAKSKRRWTIGSILVAVLLVVILMLNSGLLYTNTTAAVVGSRSYSPAELSYYYVNQYSSFLSQYGSYASFFGLDTSKGIAGLADQECPMAGEGQSWRDYFLDQALASMRQVTALNEYAKANGVALDESDLAEIDDNLALALESAKANGFSNLNRFFAAQYGTGVNEKTVRSLLCDSALASKALAQYQDSLSFSEEQRETYYSSLEGSSDFFDYGYCYVAAETVPAEGEEQDAPNEQTLLEARMTAEAIEMAYKDGYDIEDPAERLGAAVEAEFETASPTLLTRASGSNLGDLREWLCDSARQPGDVSVIASGDGLGYYVAVFIARDDNHYPTVSVRHILIKAEAGEDGTYSDEAKQAALDRINEIKAEFDSGDKSEESFAALAEKYSEDGGSNTNGGLYENIYKGEMVQEFNDFCFAPHQKGDVAVVYGESSGYAGYHLVYFVGEGELYSNVIADSALASEAVSELITEQSGTVEPALRRWAKLVK